MDENVIIDRKRIGERIKELREQAGLTQRDLAERTGLKHQNISRIEKGLYSTGIDIIARIANSLGAEILIEERIHH